MYVYRGSKRNDPKYAKLATTDGRVPAPRPDGVEENSSPADTCSSKPPRRERDKNRVPQDQSWDYHVRMLVVFVEQNGRTPRSGSKDHGERQLGQWLSWVVSRDNKNLLSDQRRQQLLNAHPLVERRLARPALKDKWEANLKATVEFLDEHDRVPHSRCGNPDEAFIGKWVQRQSILYRHGELSKEREVAFKQAHPLLAERLPLKNKFPQWQSSLDQVEAYIAQNGRLPGSDMPKLQMWIRSNASRINCGTLPADRIGTLSNAHPLLVQRMGLAAGALLAAA